MLEPVETRGCENAALPHTAAESSPHFDSAIVKAGLESNDGAGWRAESLRERDHDGVGALREFDERIPRRHCRVPKSRAVEMNGAAVLPRDVGHGFESGNWSHQTAGAVVRVLETDERGTHGSVCAWTHAAEQRSSVHHWSVALHWSQLRAAQRGSRCVFEVVNVRIDVSKYFSPSFGKQPDGDLVGHRARGTKDCALLA
ncbi:MAG TPA: hypothetical protein VH762_13540 [Gemmatimonadaceae bacterium]